MDIQIRHKIESDSHHTAPYRFVRYTIVMTAQASSNTPKQRGNGVAGQAMKKNGRPRNGLRVVSADKVASGVEMLGTKTALANYLGVSKTQPGRWLGGAEIPKPATTRLVKDLDYVWDRITTDMGPEAAKVWLQSPNGFLNGSTPLDWLKRLGPAQVISAFDAAEAGSYV